MEYFAHIERKRTQTMREHLYATAELAGEFAGQFGKEEWGYCCGLLHDIGKYSEAFQDKIRNNSDRRVDQFLLLVPEYAKKRAGYIHF